MNPYRTEKVLVDIRKRSVPNPIAVVASTDVEVELSVLADGTAYDCSGMTGSKAVFYISQDGRADTFGAVEARRGKLVFRIPADHLGYPGEYRWQIVVSDGERFSEWARGDFFIRTNPAADFEPMQLLDPPFVRKDEVLDEIDETSELPVQSKVLFDALSGVQTPIAPSTDPSAAGKPADAKATGDQLTGKADKVANATSGNLAGLDANGSLTDSGKKAADFATAAQGALAATAYQKPSTGIPATDLAASVQTSLGKADAALEAGAVAMEYDSSGSYSYYNGDYCTHDGKLWVCLDSDVSGEWDQTKWALVIVMDELVHFLSLKADTSALPYAQGNTITATAQLADRTGNRVVPLADNTTDIELTFPDAAVGRLRDFLVLVTNTTGNTGSITFTPPTGAVVYGDGFTNAPASGETWLYSVSEVAANTFWAKSVKMEVAQ